MAVLGTLEYMIRVNTSDLKSGITSSESQVKGYGNRLSTWAVAKGQMIARFAERAVSSVARFTKGSVVEAMSFDKAMSQVAATMGKSTDEIANLEKFARKMGAETAYSATEAAEALNYMALAGYKDDVAMRMLPNVLNLAAAGNIDLASASDMVTDAQSALGLKLSETETMIDQMAVTASTTNTSVAQLGEAFLTVGGTAKDLKGGTQELAAVLGVLADNGIKGAEGGTALRNVLLSLQGKSSKAAKELKSLGISAYDTAGNLRSLPEIFADFNEVFADSTTAERNSAFMRIFNARDLKSVNALLGTTTNRWKEIYTAIDDSDGAAKQMAETQLDNLSGDITKFNSALGEAKITLSDVFEPALRKFVQNGTGIVQNLTNAFKEGGLSGAIAEAGRMFNNFITELQNSDDTRLQGIGNGLATIRDIFSWIKDNWQAVSTAITMVIAALTVAKVTEFVTAINPVTAILAGIAAAAFLIIDNWDSIVEDWNQLWANIGQIVSDAWDTVSKWWTENIAQPISEAWSKVTETLSSVWDTISTTANTVWQKIKGFIQTPIETVTTWLTNTWESIKTTAINAWENLKTALSPIIDPIVQTIEKVSGAVKDVISWFEKLMGYDGEDLSETTSGHTHTNTTVNRVINETAQSAIDQVNDSMTTQQKINSLGDDGGRNALRSLFGWNAKGLATVPYDDYPTLLHRNEMVLSASQARQYREGNGGGVDYATIGTMIGNAIESALGRVGVYMSGDRVADLTTRRVEGNINANKNARLSAMGG